MKRKKWFGLIISTLIIGVILQPLTSFAESERKIEGESIYDLLVDRFNNGDGRNDFDIDIKDPLAFQGGDFVGVVDRLEHIAGMGFTMISLGTVFQAENYDGSKVLDYKTLEPHFGTEEQFTEMIQSIHKKGLYVIADFPLSHVSEQHTWVKKDEVKFNLSDDGTVDWDLTDSKTEETLKTALVAFVKDNELDGVRLTGIEKVSTDLLNEFIAAVKEAVPHAYMLTTEESAANFDTIPHTENMTALRQSFAKFDADSSPMAIFSDDSQANLIQFDTLTSDRFTHDIVEARMFPPTRWKVAATALFTLPGIPLMTYGTEIAMNGTSGAESHQLMNFKTDVELKDLISNLNLLRNQSETLRNGHFEMLHNENGFIVFKRSSEKETWIIALNNTSKTASVTLSPEVVGENVLLRGVLDGDLVRESKDGMFRIVMERELAEMFIVDEDKGFNIPYLIASILVYVLFLSFLFIVWRKGKQKRKEEDMKTS
ncbi:alpha-amylase family glycosyl hydrolase [Sporosarcina sp. HYO08]|uniref:alpha-amylase family glycosyl hydrolase n=1 Tax=Sporosarcina sp. HYO08 TaxID=1759557 RepID=UPI0007993F04|nr:alpha-amylase family glycosyl hydrolase [Sporosarcina sp. HYO08]KXH79768.1 alpha-amlyase [Sporosarcina sp. HYO08]